jgi:hypothetical protein
LESFEPENRYLVIADRNTGHLPKSQDSAYLEGYLKGRPEGLDGIVQFFPSLEAYVQWKFKDSQSPKT